MKTAATGGTFPLTKPFKNLAACSTPSGRMITKVLEDHLALNPTMKHQFKKFQTSHPGLRLMKGAV
jgi:hypothetical protein